MHMVALNGKLHQFKYFFAIGDLVHMLFLNG